MAGLTSRTIAGESIRTPWLGERWHDEPARVGTRLAGLQRTREILAGLVERYRISTAPSS